MAHLYSHHGNSVFTPFWPLPLLMWVVVFCLCSACIPLLQRCPACQADHTGPVGTGTELYVMRFDGWCSLAKQLVDGFVVLVDSMWYELSERNGVGLCAGCRAYATRRRSEAV